MHDGRQSWAWMVLRTSTTMKTNILDDLKKGVVEARPWTRQGKWMQLEVCPGPKSQERERPRTCT